MRVVRCNKIANHYYDSEKYAVCPYCERAEKQGWKPGVGSIIAPAQPSQAKTQEPKEEKNDRRTQTFSKESIGNTSAGEKTAGSGRGEPPAVRNAANDGSTMQNRPQTSGEGTSRQQRRPDNTAPLMPQRMDQRFNTNSQGYNTISPMSNTAQKYNTAPKPQTPGNMPIIYPPDTMGTGGGFSAPPMPESSPQIYPPDTQGMRGAIPPVSQIMQTYNTIRQGYNTMPPMQPPAYPTADPRYNDVRLPPTVRPPSPVPTRKPPQTVIPAFSNRPSAKAAQENEREKTPVTGWLVYLNTPLKGRSLTVGEGKNTIGFGSTFDIDIQYPQTERKEPEAVIYYESMYRKFLMKTVGRRSSVMVNGDLISETAVLSAYDRISVNGVEFVFVPLCSKSFSWETE